MRILFLTPQLPYPPHQGTAMRNFGLIRGLAQRHNVSLLSFCEPGQHLGPGVSNPLLTLCQEVKAVPAPPPRSLKRRALDSFMHRDPDMAMRLASATFSEQLAGWLARESFDVVHIEGIEMAPYLDLLRPNVPQAREQGTMHLRNETDEDTVSQHERPVVVFDDHNCEYVLQKSYAQIDARRPRRWPGAFYSMLQWQKLRRYEASVCRRVDHVLAVSDTDADALRKLVPDLGVTVIPNGIDTDEYYPIAPANAPGTMIDQPPTVVFTGKMDFRPNVDAVGWFAEEIWPRVRAEIPDARFYAVGQNPHRRLDHLRSDPSITITGWVEKVTPYIARATVYVAPLRMGSGTRLKLLQAMAMSQAIVSTRLGAEGLATAGKRRSTMLNDRSVEAEGGFVGDREMVLVDDNDPAAFAAAVVGLMHDPVRRASLGTAARTFVTAQYDWRVIVPRLEAVYVRGRQNNTHRFCDPPNPRENTPS